MNILIKTTVCYVFGLGHISRMQSLAKQFDGHDIYFQVDASSPIDFLTVEEIEFHNIYKADLIAPITLNDLKNINKSKNWSIDLKKTIKIIHKYSIDIVICDLPAINQIWINGIKVYADVVVFDDLPTGKINADIIINPNNAHDFLANYTAKNTQNVLIGQDYNPVNESYWQEFCVLKRDVKNILLYLGSAVSFEVVKSIVDALISLNKKINYIGEYSSELDEIYKDNKLLKSKKFVKNFYKEYKSADICVGACGVSYWERCHFGLPSIILKTAENQINDIDYLNNFKAIIEIDGMQIQSSLLAAFTKLEKEKNLINTLSKKSYMIVSDSYNMSISKFILDGLSK